MAPIKLEDHIREQLQEREVKSSSESWGKLQKKLNNSPKNKNNKGWFYLAASIVSIIIISSVMINQKQVITKPSNRIAEVSDSINEIEPNSNVIVSAEEIKNNGISESNNQKEATKTSTKQIIRKKNLIVLNVKEPITNINVTKPDSLKTNQIETTLVAVNTLESKKINEEEKFVNSKVEEVVAQIKNSSNAITDEEINSLLYKAQQEIYSKKLIKNTKVDAMELLSIVEDEMEVSFRERVFEALGDGYEKVRTAVVNREY